MSIKLFFRRSFNKEIEKKIKNYEFIRLMGRIIFKTNNGWSDLEKAMIDTGAPTSLIPFSIWKDISVERITDHKVAGINPSPECSIPIIIGKVNCIIVDEYNNRSREIEIHAYLAMTDEVPLILGFKDLLSKFRVCFDYAENEAFVEEKN